MGDLVRHDGASLVIGALCAAGAVLVQDVECRKRRCGARKQHVKHPAQLSTLARTSQAAKAACSSLEMSEPNLALSHILAAYLLLFFDAAH